MATKNKIKNILNFEKIIDNTRRVQETGVTVILAIVEEQFELR